MNSDSSSKQSYESLVISLNEAFLKKDLKLASNLISSAATSDTQELLSKEMIILLAACGVNFNKDDYVDFLSEVLKLTNSDEDPVGQLKSAVLKGDVDKIAQLCSNSEHKKFC